MTRVATLGMYDLPELREANDRLWTSIADHLRAHGLDGVPMHLDRERPGDDILDDPELLLAQTCGYPLMTRWAGRLNYVATPRYVAAGCHGVRHRSRIIVRADGDIDTLRESAGRRAAVNDLASNTGMNLLRASVAPLAAGGQFFSDVVVTGSHAASVAAVVEGSADIAAIDAVSFAHLARAAPSLTRSLRTIAWTPFSPNLPFVTSLRTPPAIVRLLRDAIRRAIRAEPQAATLLLLDGIESIGIARYAPILGLERRAIVAGYPNLA